MHRSVIVLASVMRRMVHAVSAVFRHRLVHMSQHIRSARAEESQKQRRGKCEKDNI
jgi:hypothetical protein